MRQGSWHILGIITVSCVLVAGVEARSLAASAELTVGRWPEAVAVRGYVDGVAVYGFGHTYIYSICPDFVRVPEIQSGNHNPRKKIRPKKSWEIENNMLGTTPPRLPRTASNDFQPFQGLHLIDGDKDTAWSSRGQSQPDVEPAWIRLDLAVETRVKEITLVARRGRRELAKKVGVQVSRDAWHWETVLASDSFSLPENSDRFSIRLEPKPIKQIWITAEGLPSCEFGHCFSLSEVKVVDEVGQNVALLSKGTGVAVSSVNFGTPSSRELHEALWGAHYDLGIKWLRVSYWDSTLNWHFVEREKGKYEIDPRSDAAITEAASNGINIVLCLAYGNWLYTDTPRRKRAKEIWEVPFDMAPAPTSREMMKTGRMLEGFKNFVRFMVRHFKDRVQYYEIYNEQDAVELWDGSGKIQRDKKTSDPAEYSRLVKEVVPVIREEYPAAKIVLGSLSPPVVLS